MSSWKRRYAVSLHPIHPQKMRNIPYKTIPRKINEEKCIFLPSKECWQARLPDSVLLINYLFNILSK
jgi:hypothetical protein